MLHPKNCTKPLPIVSDATKEDFFASVKDKFLKSFSDKIEQEVYKTSNSAEKQDTITEDEITALPYYFKI